MINYLKKVFSLKQKIFVIRSNFALVFSGLSRLIFILIMKLRCPSGVLISILGLIPATPALAESWIVVHRSLGHYETVDNYVDLDSIRVSGVFFQYHNRSASGDRIIEDVMVANCTQMTRGEWHDMRMYSVYPETVSGDELKTVCNFAQRTGLVAAKEHGSKSDEQITVLTPKLPSPSSSGTAQISSGSGFLVSTKYVVTNHHVINGCHNITVRRGDITSRATVKVSAVSSDLALLTAERSIGVAAPIRATAMLGEDIMVAGHPLSDVLSSDLIVTGGQINSLAGMGNDPNTLQISAPIQPGNSGGPLLDRSGSIVGVVVSKLNVERLAKFTGDLAQNVNFAIKPEVLRLFLDTNRIQYRSVQPGQRLDGNILAERARKFTVQVLCEQIS